MISFYVQVHYIVKCNFYFKLLLFYIYYLYYLDKLLVCCLLLTISYYIYIDLYTPVNLQHLITVNDIKIDTYLLEASQFIGLDDIDTYPKRRPDLSG